MGHTVTSRWLNGKHQIDAVGTPIGDQGEKLVEGDGGANTPEAAQLRSHFVTEDVADVSAADLVLSFTEPPRSALGNRGGRHVEFGLGLGLGKQLIVVGHRENLFHWLPCVKFFDSWAAAKESLCMRKWTMHHMGQSVTGALTNWTDRDWSEAREWIFKDNGQQFSSNCELRAEFVKHLEQGRLVIPLGDCDNWDWKTGCKGHEKKEAA
jgi:hypothetical protein